MRFHFLLTIMQNMTCENVYIYNDISIYLSIYLSIYIYIYIYIILLLLKIEVVKLNVSFMLGCG